MTDLVQKLVGALEELLHECEQGIATSPHARIEARAALQAQPAEVSDAEIDAAWVKNGGGLNSNNYRAFARAILALRPQSESEQEKELRRSLAEAQATISERNVEIIELQKRIHRSPQAVPMTEQWRLLRSGERIEAGDEGLQDDCVTWLPLAGWEVGMTYNPTSLVPMRRRVPSITAPAGGEG